MRRLFHFLFFIFLTTSSVTVASGQQKSSITIVTFGNSTTAPRKNVDSVYPIRLSAILDQHGIRNHVINAGVPGSHTGSIKDNNLFKIAHGMDRFDTAVLAHHPDWVTINFGLNDSWQDKGRKSPSRIPVDQYRHNLNYFVDQIRRSGGQVILLTPNPVGKKNRGFHTRRLRKYKRAVRQLARHKNIPLINTWKLFARYVHARHEHMDALLLDGVHPDDEGHQIIASAIAPIIMDWAARQP